MHPREYAKLKTEGASSKPSASQYAVAPPETRIRSTPPTGPPTDDDASLTPDELVEHLWERHRIRRSKRTLQLYRREGGGPAFFRAGNDVFYTRRLADEWAIERRGEPIKSNSEQSARRLMLEAAKD